ncbi:hypothetical protein [Photobacterium damselae]|uniref:hypothetical protein n=1 Tax=Photobacterium damselae TaxID=38293 RepID=UPI0040691001
MNTKLSYNYLPNCRDQQCFFHEYRKGSAESITNSGCKCTPDDFKWGFLVLNNANITRARKLKQMRCLAVEQLVRNMKSNCSYSKAVAAIQCMLIELGDGGDCTEWAIKVLGKNGVKVEDGTTAKQHWDTMISNEPKSEKQYKKVALEILKRRWMIENG